MKSKINNSLNAVQEHIIRNYKRWFKTYSDLEGVHVGEKSIQGKRMEKIYAIVFHVNKKKKKPRKKIPGYLIVSIKKNKTRIPTDVIETGKIKLNGIKIGDQTRNEGSNLVGTISFYFTTSQGTYLSSNMHVLAPNFLNAGRISYDVRNGDIPQSILLFDDIISSTAQLIVSKFNGIDFGFARIDSPQIPEVIEKLIKQVGPVTGILGLDYSNYKSVIPSFFGASSGLRICQIFELGVVKRTKFKSVYLTNLVRLNRCTMAGDSGAPVFDQNQRILGVIIGEDNDGSYALHIDDIIDYFQNSNL